MIRIAILGCDSSHTEAYTQILHDEKSIFHGQAKVEWLWGEDKNEAFSKASQLGIDNVLENLDSKELLDSDLIMVLGRYGDSHFIPAKKAIAIGKPTYIDKPFTNSGAEAKELFLLAKEKKVPVMSFSPLRFSEEIQKIKQSYTFNDRIYGAVCSCPQNTKLINHPKANSIYFYSIHAVDILVEVIGDNVNSVFAKQNSEGIWANLNFKDGKYATLNLPKDVNEFYSLILFDSNTVKNIQIDPYGNFYEETIKILINELLKGNTQKAPLDVAYKTILILDAIEKSIKHNKEILIDEKI